MRKVTAVLVGVPDPKPFEFRGNTYRFATIGGVEGDLDWYEGLIREQVPADVLTFHRLSDPASTRAAALEKQLSDAAGAMTGEDLFLLVLCGHGFQVPDDNGDEDDGLDEVFAASDGPIADDFFGALWAKVPAEADIVMFIDTCSADGLGTLGGPAPAPVVNETADGPSRLSISASMSWQRAYEVTTRTGPRGALSRGLEVAWNDPHDRKSYLTWFQAAAREVAMLRPQQNPRLRYLGPNQDLLDSVPLT